MKKTLAIGCACCAALLSGCGHNIVQYSDGVGFDLGINPENYTLSVNIRYGKIFSAVVRDNATIEMTGKNESTASANAGEKTVMPSCMTDGTVKMVIGKQVNGYLVDYVKAGGDPAIIFNDQKNTIKIENK